MGTINAVRFININYNNNSIRINDETLHFNGESTLISLHNGGGKSVLVQMLTAPFVHAGKRNATDRPFEGYFTGTKPSFILIEWLLDGGKGRVMNGFMIRKNQESNEDNPNELDIIGIISEYDRPCLYDINNLPVVEKTKKEMTLKSFQDCRTLFEGYKRDRNIKFNIFDMNQYAQQRQYFDRLREHKIDYREWEGIIKKINQRESGLSELFSDCKDERGLVDKWLLDAVENKLDPEKKRINNFRDIILKYIRQYRENEYKIKQKSEIDLFKSCVIYDGDEKSVRTLASEYNASSEKCAHQEMYIADFAKRIQKLSEAAEMQIGQNRNEIKNIDEEIRQVEHEKYSFEIYNIDLEKNDEIRNRELLTLETEKLNEALESAQRSLHIFEYASKKADYEAELKRFNEKKAKRDVLLKKDEEIRPRLESIGAGLYGYHCEKGRLLSDERADTENRIKENIDKISAKRRLIKDTGDEINTKARRLGEADGGLKAFDRKEDEFNRKYKKSLARNVLGKYEEGIFEIMLSETEKEIKAADKELTDTWRDEGELKKNAVKLSKDREKAKDDQGKLHEAIIRLSEKREKLLEDLAAREEILRLLQLDKALIFDAKEIIRTINLRIAKAEASISELKEQISIERKELKSLSEGRVTELPPEIMAGFEDIGINYAYGLKWLQENNYTLEKNVKLVRENPFLPYALVMTENELRKLKDGGLELYTSLPVPIILREKLEEGYVKSEGNIVDLDGLKFYISFNERMLNAEQLEKMLADKKADIERMESQISIKEKERNDYYSKRGIVEGRKLSREDMESTENGIKGLKEDERNAEIRIRELDELLEENSKSHENNTKRIRELEKIRDSLSMLKADMTDLSAAYEEYLSLVEEKERISAEIENLGVRRRLAEETEKELVEEGEVLGKELLRKEAEEKANSDFISIYSAYDKKDADKDEITDENIMELSTEFNALKNKFSGELTELENDLKGLDETCRKHRNALKKIMDKYALTEEETESAIYDEDRREALDERRSELLKRIEDKKERFAECRKNIAILEEKRANIRANMIKDTGYEEILPHEQIGKSDFDARKNILRHRKSNLIDLEKELQNKNGIYLSITASLSEYGEKEITEEIVWEPELSELSTDRLMEMQAEMKKEYRRINDEVQNFRNQTSDRLNLIMNIKELSDVKYRKPLEAMLRLLDSPKDMLAQIDMTILSYDTIMEKIAVDISMVEKERNEIASELSDYIENLNEGLDRIDSNSTIMVRDKSVKMLQITVPVWNENREMYDVKLKDMMDNLTKSVIAILNKNENPDDYISSRINAKNLYDYVVGTGNVSVRINKVEKQRTYQISWTDAAKNSGGEGFLSTFVILSSLLYYTRKDESDVFADKNEGKVLLMDNPFAQTNAEHLLKPLMDIAKKNHTQLICLTGLGGDSIYGRFDNIYVLNLVSAKLNSGMQYLRTEHTGGGEPENIAVSQVEVYDQVTLF